MSAPLLSPLLGSAPFRASLRRAPRLAALALALAAACGGAPGAQDDELSRGAVAALAVLAQPEGAAGADLRAGRPVQARALLEASLAREPDDLAALNDLAVSYALEARAGAARTLLEEVLARGGSADGQAALVNLGGLYAREGYLEAAAAHLASARAVDPARPEPLYALALLADARGDASAAQAALRAALEADRGGVARRRLAFAQPEARLQLEALVAEEEGEAALAAQRFRELAAGRFPLLAQAAARHLAERSPDRAAAASAAPGE